MSRIFAPSDIAGPAAVDVKADVPAEVLLAARPGLAAHELAQLLRPDSLPPGTRPEYILEDAQYLQDQCSQERLLQLARAPFSGETRHALAELLTGQSAFEDASAHLAAVRTLLIAAHQPLSAGQAPAGVQVALPQAAAPAARMVRCLLQEGTKLWGESAEQIYTKLKHAAAGRAGGPGEDVWAETAAGALTVNLLEGMHHIRAWCCRHGIDPVREQREVRVQPAAAEELIRSDDGGPVHLYSAVRARILPYAIVLYAGREALDGAPGAFGWTQRVGVPDGLKSRICVIDGSLERGRLAEFENHEVQHAITQRLFRWMEPKWHEDMEGLLARLRECRLGGRMDAEEEAAAHRRMAAGIADFALERAKGELISWSLSGRWWGLAAPELGSTLLDVRLRDVRNHLHGRGDLEPQERAALEAIYVESYTQAWERLWDLRVTAGRMFDAAGGKAARLDEVRAALMLADAADSAPPSEQRISVRVFDWEAALTQVQSTSKPEQRQDALRAVRALGEEVLPWLPLGAARSLPEPVRQFIAGGSETPGMGDLNQARAIIRALINTLPVPEAERESMREYGMLRVASRFNLRGALARR